jgi:molybdopterin converting factor small subunit
MLARVKLFGPMRLAVGQGELSFALDGSPASCAALRAEICIREPRLAGLIDGCRFAVNGRFAGEEHLLSEGDEIALIGFVSGG